MAAKGAVSLTLQNEHSRGHSALDGNKVNDNYQIDNFPHVEF
jgi:hypothetical protein